MKQGLTANQLFLMSFGGIVGVGWITVLGQWFLLAGPGGSVIALVLGALAMLLVASSYAYLANARRLDSGGEVDAVQNLLGPGPGFVVSSALALSCISVVAFEAVSAGWILVTLFPSLEGEVIYHAFGREVHSGTVVIAVLVTLAFAVLNLRPVGHTAQAQNVVVLVKIAITVVFCAASVLKGDVQNLMPLLVASTPERSTIGGILAMATTMPLWFAGFNVVAQLAGERQTQVSARAVGWTMHLSIVAACVFYICIVLAAAYVVPWQSLLSAPLPAASAFREGLSSNLMANLVLIAGLLGIISTGIACFTAASRVVNLLWRQLDPERVRKDAVDDNGRPVLRVGPITVVIAAVSILGSLAGRAALIPIVNVASLCMALVYLFMCVAACRHADATGPRVRAALGAVVAAFMCVYVLYAAVDEGGWRAPELAITVASAVIAGLAWTLRTRIFRTKDSKHAAASTFR